MDFKKAKQAIIWLLVGVITLKLVLWTLEPLFPLLIFLGVFLLIFTVAFKGRGKL